MNIFLTHFIVGTLLLFQGIQAQIRILITAEDNTNSKEKRHLTLRCLVTDTTDVHIECKNLWWTREIDPHVHREVVIGHRDLKILKTGYLTELKVQPPREDQEVYSCHALCGLQTFAATCHLGDLRNSMIECSSHFMRSYQRFKLKNENQEIYEMKKTLSIGTPLFLIMLVSLLIMAGRKFWKMFKKRKVPPEEMVEVIAKDDGSSSKKEKISNGDGSLKTGSKTEEAQKHHRPSIMVNGELIMDGSTPFAKVVRDSNDNSAVSFVQDMRALQNWDPGVSSLSLSESEDDGEEVEDFERENLLVPDNDCYDKNRSASCPEVPTVIL